MPAVGLYGSDRLFTFAKIQKIGELRKMVYKNK
jgi:hypothetical protein